MNNANKREKLKSINEKIEPLITEKIMLAAKLSVVVSAEKENDPTYMAERQRDHDRYHDLLGSLDTLMCQRQSLLCHYNVRYSGVYQDGWLNIQREEFTENFFCFTDIQLDTFEYGWKKYLEVPTFSELLKEISLMLINRYQNTEIVHIRRLKQVFSEDDFKDLPR